MKKIFTLIFSVLITPVIFAQTRYKDQVFDFVRHADIEYGSNYDNKNQLTHLLMDVYEPKDDTAAKRPIIFFVHGGSFVGGDRNDQAINKTAEYFSKKGYVTANIEYRLEQTEFIDPIVDFADVYKWHRAIARATQDLKAAIRYFKKDAAINGNSYKVDTSTIFIYGSSAGAITCLHTAYMDDTSKMSFIFKNVYAGLGGLDGNSGNPGYSSTNGIKAVVGCSGAIGDLNYLTNTKIPFLGFHNNPDFTVPYAQGCFITIACWLGQFYGSSLIYPKVKSTGTYTEFYPINKAGHPADQVSDTASHRMILQKTTDFLYRIMNPSVSTAVKNNIVQHIDLYPNPSNGNLNVTIPASLQQQALILEIFSVDGALIYTQNVKHQEVVPLQLAIPNGLYILSLKNDTEHYLSKITIMQ